MCECVCVLRQNHTEKDRHRVLRGVARRWREKWRRGWEGACAGGKRLKLSLRWLGVRESVRPALFLCVCVKGRVCDFFLFVCTSQPASRYNDPSFSENEKSLRPNRIRCSINRYLRSSHEIVGGGWNRFLLESWSLLVCRAGVDLNFKSLGIVWIPFNAWKFE